MPGKIMELPTISQALAGAPPPPQLTNTLVVTQLPPEFFAHVEILDALRDHFGAFGPLHSWAPLKAFHRAILVYYAAEDAERVKLHCDGLSLDLYPGG
jgi:calcipressin-2